MEQLSLAIHRSVDELSRFASEMRDALRDFIETDPLEPAVYVIKYRVKGFESLWEKLRSIESDQNQPDSRRDKIRAILEPTRESPVQLSDVLGVVDDLIGLRVVFLFDADKDRLLERLRRQEKEISPWFRIKSKPDGKPNIDQYVIDAWKRERDPSVKVRESGYTSHHVVLTFSDVDPRHIRFPDLHCEIQIRTVLEEAWGELDHHLAYKQQRREWADAELSNIKKQLAPIEDRLSSIHAAVADAAKHERWSPWVQLWKHYYIILPRDIGAPFRQQYEDARKCYQNGSYSDALNKYRALLGSELSERVPPTCLEDIRTQLAYDCALQHIYLGNPKDLRAAKGLLNEVLKRDAAHFFALFRLAHIEEQAGRLPPAIALAQKAIEALINSGGRVTNRSSEGLLAEARAYHSTLIFREAEAHLRKAYRSAGRSARSEQKSVSLRLAHGKIDEALSIVESAVEHTDGDRGVKLRLSNSVCYYNTQKCDFVKARASAENLKAATDNPLVLDTLGWLEYKSGGNKSMAVKLIDAGLNIMAQHQRKVPHIDSRVRTLQRHLSAVNRAISEERDYVEGEEYAS